MYTITVRLVSAGGRREELAHSFFDIESLKEGGAHALNRIIYEMDRREYRQVIRPMAVGPDDPIPYDEVAFRPGAAFNARYEQWPDVPVEDKEKKKIQVDKDIHF